MITIEIFNQISKSQETVLYYKFLLRILALNSEESFINIYMNDFLLKHAAIPAFFKLENRNTGCENWTHDLLFTRPMLYHLFKETTGRHVSLGRLYSTCVGQVNFKHLKQKIEIKFLLETFGNINVYV